MLNALHMLEIMNKNSQEYMIFNKFTHKINIIIGISGLFFKDVWLQKKNMVTFNLPTLKVCPYFLSKRNLVLK